MPIFHQTVSNLWHDFLSSSGASASELRRQWRGDLECVHPDYAPVSFPPPVFRKQFVSDITRVSFALLDVLASIPERVFGGDIGRMLQYHGMDTDEADYLLEFCSPRFIQMAKQFSRPDFLLTQDGFELVEFNVAPPVGGIGICDRVRSTFFATPWRDYLRRRNIVCSAPLTTEIWRRAILALCRRAPRVRRPVFFEATADPDEELSKDWTQPDFVATVADSGFDLLTGPIHSLDVTPRGVFAGDRRVDIVFTCFTSSEGRRYVPRSLVRLLVWADREELVDFIAPPVNLLFDSKTNLEILCAQEFAGQFTTEQQRLLRTYIPKTCRLSEASAELGLRHQAEFVLKPTAEYGGTGVLIGASTPEAQWQAALQKALTEGHPHVLQKKIAGIRPILIELDGRSEVHAMCVGPMLFGGQYAGALLRHASCGRTTPVINCAQGALFGTVFAA